MRVCKRVLYQGDVQGVGFRFTAQRIAGDHEVTGTVRNLVDGRVELVVEGEADEVERCLAAVADRMANHIADHSMNDEEPQGRARFDIVR